MDLPIIASNTIAAHFLRIGARTPNMRKPIASCTWCMSRSARTSPTGRLRLSTGS